MKGLTIKLPEATLRRLKQEAQETGRSVAALIREHLNTPLERAGASVYDRTSDLAGSLKGSRKAAMNQRRRFRRR
jgi:predicted transcriptional regulator